MYSASFRRAAFALPLALALACGSKEPVKPAGPPATFCKDGEQVCKGNYLATCTGGGTAYSLLFCGASKTCSGGKCADTVCAKGQVTCDGKTAVLKCPDDGLTAPATLQKCKTSNPAESCNDGACLPNTCNNGDVRCGDKTLFTCTQGVWVQTTCGSSQFCDTAGKKCSDRLCTPTEAKCKDSKTAQTCTSTGGGWTDKACAANEGCYDGVCHVTVASAAGSKDSSVTGTPDAPAGETSDSVSIGTGDTLVKPKKDIDVGVPDVFKVTFSKTKTPGAGDPEIKMDFPAANFLPVLKSLQISGDKDLYKVEIDLGPVEEFQTGTFSTVGAEAGDTKIYINDGSQDQTKVQWLYAATDYDIEITAFEDVGGRITGKFSAEMVNTVDKSKAYLTNGVFDIKRN